MKTIDERANETKPPICQFCKKPMQVTEFTPDRYGGHWHVKACECPGAEDARAASLEFRRKMGT